MKNRKLKHVYFRSKIFKNLFLSYISIILLCFVAYSAVIIIETNFVHKEKTEQSYHLKVQEMATVLDMQFISAKNVISYLNSSTIFKELYLNLTNEPATVDAYNLFRGLREIKYAKTLGNNLTLYEVMVFFDGYNKGYTGSDVIVLDENYRSTIESGPRISLATVNEFLGIQKNNALILNKQFVIYSDHYNSKGSNKGSVFVLFDANTIVGTINEIIGSNAEATIFLNGEPIITTGSGEGRSFTQKSFADSGLSYEIYVDEGEFRIGFDSFAVIALTTGATACIIFVVLAFYFAQNYYKPFFNIEKIIDPTLEDSKDEITDIIKGIQDLVGERNGYREKVVTITPYAKQGILHRMLMGSLENEKLKMLCEEEYIDLQKPYFILSVLNIAYVGNSAPTKETLEYVRERIYEIGREISTDGLQVACYSKDLYNIFLIVNSDKNEHLEDLFYTLHEKIVEKINDEEYSLTIGVDEVKKDIHQLYNACNNAISALDSMLVGGRGNVYFYDQESNVDRHEYYFPKDAIKRVVKAFKDKNVEELDLFLDELYRKNMNDYDISSTSMQLLIDELHITTLKALKEINTFNTTSIHIEKINSITTHSIATLEEVIAYYHQIYESVCNQLEEHKSSKKEMEKLDQEIIEYINTNYRKSDLSLAYLTEKFGVSNKYITLLCKNHLGVTYLHYIQQKRIEYAVELLNTTNDSLEKISELCGYSSLLTFRRNFKSIQGMNPSDYRQEE
jgi:AraC-like DNA-binding protein